MTAGFGLLVGLSLWLTTGEIGPASRNGSVRLAVLTPAWLAIGAIALALLALLWRGTTSRLAAAAVTLLPLMPWLPIRMPAAVWLWTGPLAWLPWIALAWTIAIGGGARFLGTPLTATRGPASRLAFVLALAVYLAGYAQVASRLPAGDEPHYLMIAQSLFADGDLAIDDNHARAEYAAFHQGELKPDYLRRGTDRRIYSVHAPGLAVLLLPAYALAGYPGTVLWLATIAALGAGLLWRLAHDLTGSADAAWFAWAGTALGVPFVFHAFAVFPDGPGSALALVGIRGLLLASGVLGASADGGPPARLSARDALLTGAALAALPWLHTRFALVSGVLGLFVAAHLWWPRRDLRAIATFAVLPVLSAAGWFAFFQAVYGTPHPAAPYGGYTQTALAHVPRGALGLLFDQQFGLVATAPVIGMAFIGIVSLMRGGQATPQAGRRRVLALELTLLVAGYLAVASAYRMWWGGASAPARFLVVLVLPLGLLLAAAWAWCRQEATRTVALAALALTLTATITFLLVDAGGLAWNARDGVARWTVWASPALELARALPSLLHDSVGVASAAIGVWIGAALVVWLAMRAAALRTATALVCGLAAMAGASVVWRLAAVAPVALDRSLARVTERAATDPSLAPVRLDLGGASAAWERIDTLIPALRLAGRPIAGAMPPLVVLPPLPAGRYRVEATGMAAGPIIVRASRLAAPLRVVASEPGRAGPRTFDLRFPVAVGSWLLEAAEPTPRVPAVSVRPLGFDRPPPGAARPARDFAGYGPVQAFFLDDRANAEPAGFWVRPGGAAEVVLLREDGHPIALHLRSAPADNQVRLRAGGWQRTLTFADGAEQRLELPPGESGVLLLEIEAARGRRPTDLDPQSRDSRLLGVWVGVE